MKIALCVVLAVCMAGAIDWVPAKENHVVTFVHSETTYRHVDSLGPSPAAWLYGSASAVSEDVLKVGPVRVEFYDKKPGFCDSLGPCLARLTIRLLPKHRYPRFIHNMTSWYRYRKPIPRSDSLGKGTLWARWEPLPDEDGEIPGYAYIEDTGWVLVPLSAMGNAFYRMRAQRPGESEKPRLFPLRPGAPVIDDGR